MIHKAEATNMIQFNDSEHETFYIYINNYHNDYIKAFNSITETVIEIDNANIEDIKRAINFVFGVGHNEKNKI